MANIYKNLERLNRLHKDGAITAEEFEQEKAKILNENQQHNKTVEAPRGGKKKEPHTLRFNVSLSIPVVGQLLSHFSLGGQQDSPKNSNSPVAQAPRGMVLMNPILLLFIYILLITLLLNTLFGVGNIILIVLAVIALLVGLFFIIRLIDKAIRDRQADKNKSPYTINFLEQEATKEATNEHPK